MRPVLIFYFKIKAAWVLRQQRRRAGISLQDAAHLVNIDSRKLLRYELGLQSPPLRTIYGLLRGYEAEDSAVLFFCTARLPAPALTHYVGHRRQLRWALAGESK